MEKLPSKLQEKTFSQISIAIGMWGRHTAYVGGKRKQYLLSAGSFQKAAFGSITFFMGKILNINQPQTTPPFQEN